MIMEKRHDWRRIFPYQPRPDQVAFVESIEQAVDNEIPAILEGRNGLGKTLAALCGYLQYDGRIVYLTRTHQQVRHVCDEIAKIHSESSLPFTAVAIGSRQRLCLNPHLVYEDVFQKNPTLASHSCRRIFQLTDTNGCRYCKFIDRSGKTVRVAVDLDYTPTPPALCDVDTLKEFGKANGICPYYLGMRLAHWADVVVSPFQYIIDPLMRKRIKFDLTDTKIVIDEAHSIPSLCCSILSKRITSYTIQKAYGEAVSAGHRPLQQKIDDVKTLFRRIPTKKMKEIAKDQRYIFGDIFRVILSNEGFGDVWLRNLLSYRSAAEEIQEEIFKTKRERSYIFDLIEFFDRLYNNDPAASTIMWETRKTQSGIVRMLDYACLDPSIVFQSLTQYNNPILLMSGSLSPRNAFQFDLGIQKAYSCEFAPLNQNNCIAFVLRKYNGEKLTTSWADRKKESVVRNYGELILDFLQLIPQGSLIFFPSYAVKDAFLTQWEMDGIYDRMRATTDLYYEESTPEFEEETLPEFLKQSETHQTALFGVTRGKVSEGFDAPNIIKGIFVIGVPLADWGSPYVQAQIDFHNKLRGTGEGSTWYHNDAMKWTNQNAGRGVRVVTDFCAVFLVDYRFGSGQYYHKLSESVRNCIVKPAFLMDTSYAKEKVMAFFEKKTKK